MPLIATCIDSSGVARLFFDMRPIAPSLEDLLDIAVVIERAFVLADTDAVGFPAPGDRALPPHRLE